MKLSPTRPAGTRGGFTLIELLVVIAIIAVLLALTIPAVFKVLAKGPEAQNRDDLTGLNQALEMFKTDYGRYPPSKFVVCQSLSSYNTGIPQEAESQAFLRKMFPEASNFTIIYDNNGNPAPAGTKFTLEGKECLVFFLGGTQISTNGVNGCQGYNTDPVAPFNPAVAGKNRKPPYYQFKSNRLKNNPNTTFTNFAGYCYYNDPYGMPYLYFSSYNLQNGYRNGDASQGVSPYYQSPGQYLNPKTFQIVSAGPDKVFGTTSLWSAQNPAQGVGRDDVSNFHERMLGAP